MGNSSCPETSDDGAEKEKWDAHLKWFDEKATQFQNHKNKEGIAIDKKIIDDAQKKFEEYQRNPTLATYIAAAQAHVLLVDTGVAKYENSLNDVCFFFFFNVVLFVYVYYLLDLFCMYNNRVVHIEN